MKYNSLSTPIDFGFDFHMAMGPTQINLSDQNMKAPASFVGKLSTDYVQLLPKFAIQYEWKNQIMFMPPLPGDIVREDITSRCSLIYHKLN